MGLKFNLYKGVEGNNDELLAWAYYLESNLHFARKIVREVEGQNRLLGDEVAQLAADLTATSSMATRMLGAKLTRDGALYIGQSAKDQLMVLSGEVEIMSGSLTGLSVAEAQGQSRCNLRDDGEDDTETTGANELFQGSIETEAGDLAIVPMIPFCVGLRSIIPHLWKSLTSYI